MRQSGTTCSTACTFRAQGSRGTKLSTVDPVKTLHGRLRAEFSACINSDSASAFTVPRARLGPPCATRVASCWRCRGFVNFGPEMRISLSASTLQDVTFPTPFLNRKFGWHVATDNTSLPHDAMSRWLRTR